MIKTEYKGMSIHWSDNEDQWNCMELKFSSPSLAKVKKKIDTFRKKERDGVKYTALYIGTFSAKLERCEIVEYIGEKPSRFSREDGAYVAVMRSSGLSDKKTRNEDKLKELAPDIPDVHQKAAQVKKIEADIQRLNAEKDAVIKSIPRLTEADIPELVKIHETIQGEVNDM